jgi:O-antigen ligase
MTLLGIVLSGSRVIIPLALIFICAHFIRNIASFSRSGFTAAAVVMFGLSIVPVITQIIPQMWAPIERILSSSDDTAGSSLARVESVVTALRLVAERPVFGHGPGQIYAWSRVPEGQLAADKVLVLDQGLTLVEPHSFPMIIAVEYGLLTLIMFGAMMLAVIWQWYLNEGSKANKTIPASIVGICLFSVQSVGSSDIAIMPHVAMIFWIWCGCCTILQSGSLASVDGRVRA